MSGDTWPWCRSIIWEEGTASSCLVPGQGEAAWYAEAWTSGTADILSWADGEKAERLREITKIESLSLSLSLFLPLLSWAKSGSVCIMAFKKVGVCPPTYWPTTYPAHAFVKRWLPHPDSDRISSPPFILAASPASMAPAITTVHFSDTCSV